GRGSTVVPDPGWGFRIMTILTVTTGTAFIMWLGEQITDRGIGNGSSMIIFAGIVAAMPDAITQYLAGAGGRAGPGGGGGFGFGGIILGLLIDGATPAVCFF